MPSYYLIAEGAIASGPHAPQSQLVRRLTRTGNPEVLPATAFAAVGLVPEVFPPLSPGQEYAEGVLTANKKEVRRRVVRKQAVNVLRTIRDTAVNLKQNGGFLPPAPAGNTKWIPSDAYTLATLAMYALAATLPAGIDVKAMDGTNYGITAARLKVMADAYAAQMAAIDVAEAAARVRYEAAPDDFDVTTIEWPAVYAPAP